MSNEAQEAVPPVAGLDDPEGRKWYRTLDEAIHAWAEEKTKHGPTPLGQIWVYLHPHIGGWRVE
jgi:hypothetical protein